MVTSSVERFSPGHGPSTGKAQQDDDDKEPLRVEEKGDGEPSEAGNVRNQPTWNSGSDRAREKLASWSTTP